MEIKKRFVSSLVGRGGMALAMSTWGFWIKSSWREALFLKNYSIGKARLAYLCVDLLEITQSYPN